MSKAKHKSHRKVLMIERFNAIVWDKKVPSVRVLWCIPSSETRVSVKTRHLVISYYVGGLKGQGIESRMPMKDIRIKLNAVTENDMVQSLMSFKGSRAFAAATEAYLNDKSLTVEILSFCHSRGEALVRGTNGEGVHRIYACNIPGKKTWYAETACVYYDEGQIVDAIFKDGFILPITPGTFDKARWESLDHDKLAFRCDDDGNAISGLFAKGAGLWE